MLMPAQLRLLLLTSLLLCTTIVLGAERAATIRQDAATVFQAPPAYLHPAAVLRFDLSGLGAHAKNRTEAALIASARIADDVEDRAHTHLSLAVYYKMHGRTQQAVVERRKGEYWRRIAWHVPADEPQQK